MAQAVATAKRNEAKPRLSNGHLASIARTCEQASSPVWVYDLSSCCIYRNPAAEAYRRNGTPPSTFEIMDHAGRVVGHLATVNP